MTSRAKGKSSSKKLLSPEAAQREENQQKQLKSLNPTQYKQQIYQYKKQANQLIAEVNRLNTQIATNNEKHLQNTFENQNKLKQEEENMNSLRAKYESMLKATAAEQADTRRAWENEKKEINNRRNKEYSEAMERYEELSRRLQNIRVFKSKQDEYVATIEQLKSKIEQAEDIRKQELNKIRLEHSRVREKIDQDTKKQIEQIKHIQHLHAQAKLGDKEKQTKKENDLLAGQIELYKLEEEQLSIESLRLQAEIRQQKQLLSELSQANPTLQTHERSMKIINLQQKMGQLKTYLETETRRMDEEAAKLKNYYDKQEQKMEQELKTAKASIRSKEKQIKDIKMYSQMVLDQRGSLEWYLLEVLNQDENESKSLDNILRSLFVKINSGVPPPSWRSSTRSSQNLGAMDPANKSINEESSIEERSERSQQ